MTWNHRILANVQDNGSVYFQIHEVYYDKFGKPDSYTLNPITLGAEDIDGIKWTLKRIKKCLKKPILYHGEKFPKEYKKQ